MGARHLLSYLRGLGKAFDPLPVERRAVDSAQLFWDDVHEVRCDFAENLREWRGSRDTKAVRLRYRGQLVDSAG